MIVRNRVVLRAKFAARATERLPGFRRLI